MYKRQPSLSRFLVYPPSGRPPRRLSDSGTVFIERPAGAIRGDASYAIGRDWPCANLAYHSRTLLFSPLAELRRGRREDTERDTRDTDREKCDQQQ